IAGSIGDDASVVYENGIDALMGIISYPMSLETAIEKASVLLADAAERTIRLIKLSS
ncbi:glycerate kinase, partial [Candidatus Poribacteria bacterium]|nr:glycerate kinase [Candidatus Poribacteria bacterium]